MAAGHRVSNFAGSIQMSITSMTETQPSLFPDDDAAEVEYARSLLDQLLSDSRLYRSGEDYQNLLGFVVRMRNFAPFNAMLLQIQKPGLMYAASARDWRERFNRWPKEDARPLLILWPFGPVALVYDVQDTEGEDLPVGINAFSATGAMTAQRLTGFFDLLAKKHIIPDLIDAGDGRAGAIRIRVWSSDPEMPTVYRIAINKAHPPAVQFATLAHELGHLSLGHLGPNKALKIPDRHGTTFNNREIEAESVAYLVCHRNGVTPNSESYLSNFIASNQVADSIDLYQITRAAGQVESLLGLTAHTRFDGR